MADLQGTSASPPRHHRQAAIPRLSHCGGGRRRDLKVVVTFVVPISFAVTVPAQAVTNRLEFSSLVGSVALAVVLVIAARIFWQTGIKHYSGASA